MNKKNYNLATVLILISLAVALRILPHPANFAPVAAIAVFGGAILPRRLAIWAPLSAMVISDMIIGLHHLVLLTWGCYALIALASNAWLKRPLIVRGAALTMGSSLFFFVVTNFGVWMWDKMYAHSFSGLVQCYTMALPFFRNTALSDVVYTASLFGAYYLAQKAGKRFLQKSPARS